MKILTRCFTLIGLSLAMTSCVTVVVPKENETTNPYKPVPQVETPVTPVTGTAVLDTTPEQPSMTTYAVTAVQDKPRVSLDVTPGENTEIAEFCGKLILECAEKLMPANARIVTEEKADMRILIDAEFKEVSSFGEYARIECKTVRARILGIREQELSGMILVHPKAMERKLGRDEAINQYIMPVASQMIPRLRTELERLSRETIAVEEITFLIKCTPSPNATDEYRRQIQRIKNILNSEKGIMSWEILTDDALNQKCTYRVVYMRSSYPEGLANKLGTK